MTYTITLADGRTIDGLTLNGNNFRSETKITEDIFKDNLSVVHITASGDTPDMMMPPPVLHNAELVQITPPDETPDGLWWFILRELSPYELFVKATQSAQTDIDNLMVDQEYRLTLMELGITDTDAAV